MPVLTAPVNVELGNHDPKNAIDNRPTVTKIHIPASYTHAEGLSGDTLRAELERSMNAPGNTRGVTRLPEHEGLISITHPFEGHWVNHTRESLSGGRATPKWVWSDNPDVARVLSELWQCPADRPGGYEELYWRKLGPKDLAPGVMPGTVSPTALLTNVGRSIWAQALGGGLTGLTGTATATTSTSLTSNTVSSVSANQFAGYRVYAGLGSGGMVWGNIVSHTSGTTPVFAVDQWYAIPDGTGNTAAPPYNGTTPSGTGNYAVASGGSVAAWYMGITTTNITPNVGDTSLSGESVVSGMARKISTWALTSGTSPAVYTLTAVYTLGTAGLLTFYALGLFTGCVKSDTTDSMMFETSFSAPFSVQNIGDAATCSDTVSGS